MMWIEKENCVDLDVMRGGFEMGDNKSTKVNGLFETKPSCAHYHSKIK